MEQTPSSHQGIVQHIVEVGTLYQQITDRFASLSMESNRINYARYFQGWLTGRITVDAFDTLARNGLHEVVLELHKQLVMAVLHLGNLEDPGMVRPVLKRVLMQILKANRTANIENEPPCHISNIETRGFELLVNAVEDMLKNLLDSVLYKKCIAADDGDANDVEKSADGEPYSKEGEDKDQQQSYRICLKDMQELADDPAPLKSTDLLKRMLVNRK